MMLLSSSKLCKIRNLIFIANNKRNLKITNFGNKKESIYERTDYPISQVIQYFKNKKVSVLGYGPQGRAQALNLKDNGIDVAVGVRNFEDPIKDGFVKGKDLFSIEEATDNGNIVLYHLSDAGQKEIWPKINPLLINKTLCFSHGFSIVYSDQTKVIPPKNIDVIMVAPKGTGSTLRKKFLNGDGVNSSIAIHQDYTGSATETVRNLAFAIGSGNVYHTTFHEEVYSDLVGERGALMGGIHGLFLAQYNVLREMGHSPTEAFNETVEEATQSLIPLISEKGMDWMYANCSTTAQRGAIDWYPKFEEALKPVFRELYKSVKDGKETEIVLKKNTDKNYREELNKELNHISEMEIWKVGNFVRSLR